MPGPQRPLPALDPVKHLGQIFAGAHGEEIYLREGPSGKSCQHLARPHLQDDLRPIASYQVHDVQPEDRRSELVGGGRLVGFPRQLLSEG